MNSAENGYEEINSKLKEIIRKAQGHIAVTKKAKTDLNPSKTSDLIFSGINGHILKIYNCIFMYATVTPYSSISILIVD